VLGVVVVPGVVVDGVEFVVDGLVEPVPVAATAAPPPTASIVPVASVRISFFV
jgi:hypothetical protein